MFRNLFVLFCFSITAFAPPSYGSDDMGLFDNPLMQGVRKIKEDEYQEEKGGKTYQMKRATKATVDSWTNIANNLLKRNEFGRCSNLFGNGKEPIKEFIGALKFYSTNDIWIAFVISKKMIEQCLVVMTDKNFPVAVFVGGDYEKIRDGLEVCTDFSLTLNLDIFGDVNTSVFLKSFAAKIISYLYPKIDYMITRPNHNMTTAMLKALELITTKDSPKREFWHGDLNERDNDKKIKKALEPFLQDPNKMDKIDMSDIKVFKSLWTKHMYQLEGDIWRLKNWKKGEDLKLYFNADGFLKINFDHTSVLFYKNLQKPLKELIEGKTDTTSILGLYTTELKTDLLKKIKQFYTEWKSGDMYVYLADEKDEYPILSEDEKTLTLILMEDKQPPTEVQVLEDKQPPSKKFKSSLKDEKTTKTFKKPDFYLWYEKLGIIDEPFLCTQKALASILKSDTKAEISFK